jgi:hypothetical protein
MKKFWKRRQYDSSKSYNSSITEDIEIIKMQITQKSNLKIINALEEYSNK